MAIHIFNRTHVPITINSEYNIPPFGVLNDLFGNTFNIESELGTCTVIVDAYIGEGYIDGNEDGKYRIIFVPRPQGLVYLDIYSTT